MIAITKERASEMVLANCFYDKNGYSLALRSLEPSDFPTKHTALFDGIRSWALTGQDLCPHQFSCEHPAMKPLICTLPFEHTDFKQAWWISKLKQFGWEDRSKHAVLAMQDLLSKDANPTEKQSKLRALWKNIEGNGESEKRLISLADAIEPAMSCQPIITGFHEWDEMVGGMMPGTIHVLAGRPGRGKTTLAMQWAADLAHRGYPTIFVPLEVGVARAYKLAKKQGNLPKLAYLLDAPAKSWEELAADFSSWALEPAEAKVVFIDHLGYLKKANKRKNESRAEEIGDILRDLRVIMRIHECVAVLVCQLNRAVEGRKSERPRLADLRESGEIEQEADSATFLWAKKEQLRKAKAEWVMSVEKSRDGAMGDVVVYFDRPGRRFERQPF